MRYAKGIMWLDDCRIPFVDEGDTQQGKVHYAGATGNGVYGWNKEIKESGKEYNITQGRFTPNLLVCDDMLNDGNIYKSGDGKGMSLINHNKNNFAVGEEMTFIKKGKTIHYGDKGTNSRYYDLDKWFDKMIDEIR